MRIGILVDGQSEYYGLPFVIPKIRTNLTILKPLYSDIQPFSSPALIAHVAMKAARILIDKAVSVIIILLDKESRPECSPQLAQAIDREFTNQLNAAYPSVSGSVVVKVSTFENWLIADPTVFTSLTGMFHNIERIGNAVIPNKADNCDAINILKNCSNHQHLDKVKCSKSICEKLSPDKAASNSRSFRRFLRILGHYRYLNQSKLP